MLKSRTLRLVIVSQFAVVLLFLAMTISNEVLDLPHFIFGDKPTSFEQRTGEIAIEILITLGMDAPFSALGFYTQSAPGLQVCSTS